MKKNICYFLSILIIFVGFTGVVSAKIKVEKNNVPESFKRSRMYIASDGNSFFTLNKNNRKEIENTNIVMYYTSHYYFADEHPIINSLGKGLALNIIDTLNQLAGNIGIGGPVTFFTTTEDEVEKNDDAWWGTLYACTQINFDFWDQITKMFTQTPSQNYFIFTSSMDSSLQDNNLDAWGSFLQHFGGESVSCKTFEVQNVEEKNKVYTCKAYSKYKNKIAELKSKYKELNNNIYKKEYDNTINTMKSLCNQAMSSSDYNDACLRQCFELSKDKKEWDKVFYPDTPEKTCGFSNKLISWVLNIIKWVKYIIPAIVIIFGILDFVKAIGADKDDEMKKAQGRFIKRLIAAALIFIVPFIIEFVLDKMGFEVSSCGIIRELD